MQTERIGNEISKRGRYLVVKLGMFSLVTLLSGIYPFHAIHSLLVTIILRDIGE